MCGFQLGPIETDKVANDAKIISSSTFKKISKSAKEGSPQALVVFLLPNVVLLQREEMHACIDVVFAPMSGSTVEYIPSPNESWASDRRRSRCRVQKGEKD